jgi:hypothetical protein
MSATGLLPDTEDKPLIAVPKERLVEFDRLMAQGGIEVVMQSFAADDKESAPKRARTK